MRIVTTFPHNVRDFEHCWIPMPDGCRLAARIWLPEGALTSPVPAIVEYIPYRKRDRTRWRDEPIHRYFAGYGYASVRIDLRGAGESDGLLRDEYLDQELDDGIAAIRWIASRPWCSGVVGMMGKSWGGFNSLQVAARRPPELRAIITVCSTDDRYADDAHYMGGCLLNENLLWGSTLLTINAQPPDPELVGERWRAMWFERLGQTPLFVEQWLRHQRRDGYWKHGSVCEDYSRIACPVYAIGGWADGYSNSIPRLLAGLKVPRKGLIGPWAHVYPHVGVPGPAMGFLQEAVRWWDHWLKGIDVGIMDEPMYRVWMQESVPPQTSYATRPGRWVAEATWPSADVQWLRYAIGARGLTLSPQDPSIHEIRSPQTVGMASGRWCSFGVDGDLPDDQGADDGESLVFETEPLTERVEILGAVVAMLAVAADRPVAYVAARLCDVSPNGAVARVTYGVLNLTHRRGHERPEPLAPGERYTVRVQLNDVAYAFPAGHRIRLALSSTYWPLVWPAPDATVLQVFGHLSQLELPMRAPRAGDAWLRPFESPEGAPPLDDTEVNVGGVHRVAHREARGELVITTSMDRTPDGDVALTHVHPIDLAFGHAVVERYRIHPDDPSTAQAEVIHEVVSKRDHWSVRIETRTEFSADREHFRVRCALVAYEGEAPVCSRNWDCVVPRDFV